MEEKKTMFTWIEDILIRNGYEKVKIGHIIDEYIKIIQGENQVIQYELYKAPQDRVQYVLAIDVYDMQIEKVDLQKVQMDIYKRLLKLENAVDCAFDKNVSLLLCAKWDISDTSSEREVLKIEEDPYCFKKLVLTYTDNEIDEMQGRLGEKNIWEYMKDTMQNIKDGAEMDMEETVTKMVLKLYIKMPFLPMDVAGQRDKDNLMQTIEGELEEINSDIWSELKEMSPEAIEEIKLYSDDQIDSIMKKWYTEEA